MEVYMVDQDRKHYAWLSLADPDADPHAFTTYLDSVTRADWVCPARLTLRQKALPHPDYIWWLPDICIFSRRALDCLNDLLTEAGDVFPLDCPGADYYAFRPKTVEGSLNTEDSEIDWLDRRVGAMSEVYYYSFYPQAVENLTLFRISGTWGTYCTTRFLARVQDCGLTGFVFNLIWPLLKRPKAKLPG